MNTAHCARLGCLKNQNAGFKKTCIGAFKMDVRDRVGLVALKSKGIKS